MPDRRRQAVRQRRRICLSRYRTRWCKCTSFFFCITARPPDSTRRCRCPLCPSCDYACSLDTARGAHRQYDGATARPGQGEIRAARNLGKRTTCRFETRMPGFQPLFLRHPRAYYARPSPSIMPGQTWRDNGHKALCSLSTNGKRKQTTS